MNIAIINFLATLSQTVVGFGAPLISMPFMIVWLGAKTATPLSALVGLLTSVFVLIYYRSHFNLQAVIKLLAAAVIGVPVGTYLLNLVDARSLKILLGVIVIGYALYSLASPKLPKIQGKFWEYIFGFFAGIMGGALNTSGPIVVIYASFKQWKPEEFRSNLQGFFIVTNVVIMVSHYIGGNLDSQFAANVGWAIGGMLVAIVVGLVISSRVNEKIFRTLIIIVLIASGIQLLR
ncbi:MAG TPA: sulfite exporter TauE/SafE family protein [Anaerolineales bacterium]|jgi:uncharacterized membrane protein YfcA|nr:sulfite exporter TauE/SafE family protein [Anaerolineales bacterium]